MKYRDAMSCIIMILLTIYVISAADIGFGVKGGLNFANMYGQQAQYISNRTGFNAGLFFNIELSDVFEVQPEVLYMQKGGRYVPPDWVFLMMIDYIVIPVLIKGVIPAQSGTKFNIFTGLYGAYNVIAKGRLENDTLPDADIDNINNIDSGLVFGAGLDFPLSSGEIIFEGRYELGLLQVSEADYDFDRKNDCISVMLGYSFR